MKSNSILPAMLLAAAAVAPAQTPTKVAIINLQNAILSTKDGQKASAEMAAKFNPKKSELDKRQAEVQGLQDQLRKGQATMSEDAKQKLMRDIDSNSTRLKRDTEDAQAELDEETGKVYQELGNKMTDVVIKYATQNGYAMVVDVSNQQSPVFWAAPEIDITNEIVKLYDQAHPATATTPAAAAPKPAAPKPVPGLTPPVVPPVKRKQ